MITSRIYRTAKVLSDNVCGPDAWLALPVWQKWRYLRIAAESEICWEVSCLYERARNSFRLARRWAYWTIWRNAWVEMNRVAARVLYFWGARKPFRPYALWRIFISVRFGFWNAAALGSIRQGVLWAWRQRPLVDDLDILDMGS